MAAIEHVSAEQTTIQTHTGDTTWTDVLEIAAVNFVDNAVYLIIVNCQWGGSSQADNFGMRFVHGGTPTLFPGSDALNEPPSSSATVGLSGYTYMTVFTQPSTAELVKLQFMTVNTGRTVRADSIEIHAIRLDVDLVDGVDYKWAEVDDSATPVVLTTTYVEKANIVFTPINANDTWLVLGSVCWDVNHVSSSTLTKLRHGTDPAAASSVEDAPLIIEEGEDLTDRKVFGIQRAFVLPGTSQEFALDMRDDSATDEDDHVRTFIFALRLNAFETFEWFWEQQELDPTTSGVEIANVDITPVVTGDYLLLGCSTTDNGNDLDSMAVQMTVDGIETPTGVYLHTATLMVDGGDRNAMFISALRSLASGAERDIDMDAKEINSGAELEARSLVVFSMELSPPHEQEGYRWRNDDGSESAATWLANQDTDISRGKESTTRLRLLTDVTGDPDSAGATVQFRAVGDGVTEWEDIA